MYIVDTIVYIELNASCTLKYLCLKTNRLSDFERRSQSVKTEKEPLASSF